MLGYELAEADLNVPAASYKCGSCKRLPRDAIQTSCGHLYCLSCLANLIVPEAHIPTIKCLEDDTILTLAEVFPDMFRRREISQLPVQCTFAEKGCKWKGQVKTLEVHHRNDCPWSPVTCSKCNKDGVPRCKMAEHQDPSRGDCDAARGPCPSAEVGCPLTTVLPQDLPQGLPQSLPQDPLLGLSLDPPQGLPQDPLLGLSLDPPQGLPQDPLLGLSLDPPQGLPQDALLGLSLDPPQSLPEDLPQSLPEDLPQGLPQEDPPLGLSQDPPLDLPQDHKDERLHEYAALYDSLQNLSRLALALRPSARPVERRPIRSNQGPVTVPTSLGMVDSSPEGQRSEQELQVPNENLRRLERRVEATERALGIQNVAMADIEEQVRQQQASSYDGVLLWKIDDFSKRKTDAISGRQQSFYSPCFYTSRHGYKMCARIYLNGDGMGRGTHISVFFTIMRGQFDALLRWPFRQKVTIMLLDQDNVEHVIDPFRPDPNSASFQKPRREMNIASGYQLFCSLAELNKRAYVRDDVMFMKIIVDTSDL